jgi:hypothetical protein
MIVRQDLLMFGRRLTITGLVIRYASAAVLAVSVGSLTHAAAYATRYSLVDRTLVDAADRAVPVFSFVWLQMRAVLSWLNHVDSLPSNAGWMLVKDPWLEAGAYTFVSWNFPGATTCTAFGSWDGQLPPTGTAKLGPVEHDANLVMVCAQSTDAGNQNVLQVEHIGVRSAHLTWAPPYDASFDSSGGFRIDFGPRPDDLPNHVMIDDPAQRSYTMALTAGVYFFRVASLGPFGSPTAYSNVGMKEIE